MARHPPTEAFLALQRLAAAMLGQVADLMKAHGLSPEQFNVLRILRGAGAEGLPCGEIAARMISRDPDMTRLLDRLEKRGLVERSRHGADRRVVLVRITAEGRSLLGDLDAPVRRLHEEQFSDLGAGELAALLGLLNRLLAAAQAGAAQSGPHAG